MSLIISDGIEWVWDRKSQGTLLTLGALQIAAWDTESLRSHIAALMVRTCISIQPTSVVLGSGQQTGD